MDRVLVTPRSFLLKPMEARRILEEAGCEVVQPDIDRPLRTEEMIAYIKDVDGVVVGVDDMGAEVIAAAPRLKVISKHGVGVDNIDIAAATQAGIVVTNTPGTNHIAVAELTLGFMIGLARSIPQADAKTRAGSWSRPMGVELNGKTLGLVGLGRIGLVVAQLARAFEMHVLYYDVVRHIPMEAEGWLHYADLKTLINESDFVSLHCPLLPETYNIIGEEQLRAMKPTAYLINAARGGLIDEVALVRALQEGWIAGAALDAFVDEPPINSPLLALPNVILSPHAGAWTSESAQRMATMSARNVVSVLRGERPDAVLNPSVYERRS